MSSLNRVVLIGNLTRDPEIRATQDGQKVGNLNVATNDTWKDKNTGERKSRAEFHRIVVFNERLVEVAEKYLHKGSKLYLEGSLQTRKWTDSSGAEKYTTEIVLQKFKGEIVLLDTKADEGTKQDVSGYGSGADDEDIPFA